MQDKTLEDFLDFFKENLTTKEKDLIKAECECSIATIYNYLKGEIKDFRLANDIMTSGVNILKARGVEMI